MKSICLLSHKAGVSKAEFERHYEEVHAPLAVRYFPFTRYVRNHVLEGQDVGFDTLSEFWAPDVAALGALTEGPIGEIMRADEDRFLDREASVPAGSEEAVFSPGAPADAHGRRTALFVSAKDAARLSASLSGWARELASAHPGVSVDITAAWGPARFPADAVLWLPGKIDPGPAPGGLSFRAIAMRHCETPREDLL